VVNKCVPLKTVDLNEEGKLIVYISKLNQREEGK
jgi:hypothetical protein